MRPCSFLVTSFTYQCNDKQIAMSGCKFGLFLFALTVAQTGLCHEASPRLSCRERTMLHGTARHWPRGASGLLARYSCDPGFLLQGAAVAACSAGRWSHPPPECLRIEDIQGVSEDDPRQRAEIVSFAREDVLGDSPTPRNIVLPLPESSTTNTEVTTTKSKPQRKGKQKTDGKKKGGRKGLKRKKSRRRQKDESSAGSNNRSMLHPPPEFIPVQELSSSCLVKGPGQGLLRAPEAPPARVLKYSRRNTGPPHNRRFLVALYSCPEDMVFEDPRSDRMFCANGSWKGTLPNCIPQRGRNHSLGRGCGDGQTVCDQLCHTENGDPKCSCTTGFRLFGNTACVDVDECEENNGGCEYLCENIPGSFRCSCRSGYRLDASGRSCVDVDECTARDGHGPCQGTCENTIGSYKCSCAEVPGTQLAQDGHSCHSANTCPPDHGCSHHCINTRGGIFCVCPEGLALGPNWKTCADIDECQDAATTTTCKGCVNTFGSYHCSGSDDNIQSNKSVYDPGSGLTDDTVSVQTVPLPPVATKPSPAGNDEDDEEAPKSGHQENETTSRGRIQERVTCDGGYEKNGQGECVDIDECENSDHGCSHRCVNLPGSYKCVCPRRLVLSSDDRSCVKRVCGANNCTHQCAMVRGHQQCSCPQGFKLAEDGISCDDIDECGGDEKSACSHDCHNTLGSYRCGCPNGFILEKDGKTCVDVDECAAESSRCSHRCVNTEGSYRCTCPDDMTLHENGTLCVRRHVCPPESGCSHDCMSENGVFRCVCPEGYVLGLDSKQCVDEEDCVVRLEDKCHLLCVDSDGIPECECGEGYVVSSDSRSCEDIDECSEGKADCSHVCVNFVGGFTCDCPLGFRLGPDNRTCVDIDECAEGTSMGDVCPFKCVNNVGSYYCECFEGFEVSDGNTCVDIDECSLGKHNCSQTCVNLQGSYRCSCVNGYETGDDDVCQDVNECTTDDGQLHNCSHICVNLVGSYRCDCPQGFELTEDNKNCQDINECEEYNGTDGLCEHECVNEIGSFRCTCPLNYKLINNTCEDINECLENNGGCSHFCENTEGSYNCSCPNGLLLFNGGKTCVEENRCLVGNGGCSHYCGYNGTNFCSCAEGYILHEGGYDCIDINECSANNGNCSHECVNVHGGYRCECPEGYNLKEDQTTICHVNSSCSYNNGGCSHTCSLANGEIACLCPQGYRITSDDPKRCEDIDECSVEDDEEDSEGGSPCAYVCTNTPGSYFCLCPPGYKVAEEDPHDCADIDECLEGSNCSHFCNNTLGSYVCYCEAGMYLENERTCRYQNACRVNNGNCSHECLSTPQGVLCSCPRGYSLNNETKKHCQDVDECSAGLLNCTDTQECVNVPGSAFCVCSEGFTLEEDRKTCVPETHCDKNNGGCSHTCNMLRIGAHCSCPENMKLGPDEKNCVCDHLKGNCSDSCHVEDGNFTCTCPEGMEIGSDAKTCQPVPRCNGRGCFCPNGLVLSEDGRSCSPGILCTNSSTECSQVCRSIANDVVCSCPDGFISSEQHGLCLKDFCADNNGGCEHKCTKNEDGEVVCLCPVGTSLDADESRCVSIDTCAANNGGCSHECIQMQPDERIFCRCPSGLTLNKDGKTCLESPCGADNGGCSHFCTRKEEEFACSCPANYTLAMNGKDCLLPDPCLDSNGGCSHFCVSVEGKVMCDCPDGFTLKADEKECIQTVSCGDDNGQCSHHCEIREGSIKCSCPENYMLLSDEMTCVYNRNCSIENGGCSQLCLDDGNCSCYPNHVLNDDGWSCRQKPVCAVNAGGCSHMCVDGLIDVECHCPVGYEIGADSRTCYKVRHCVNDNGGCSHRCRMDEDSEEVVCSCRGGYALMDDSKTCVDVDECAPENGGCSHICVNVDGGFKCRCPPELSLSIDGKTCSDYGGKPMETKPCLGIPGISNCECEDFECAESSGPISTSKSHHSSAGLPTSPMTTPISPPEDRRNSEPRITPFSRPTQSPHIADGSSPRSPVVYRGEFEFEHPERGSASMPPARPVFPDVTPSDRLATISPSEPAWNRGCDVLALGKFVEMRCPGFSYQSVYPVGAQCYLRCQNGYQLVGPTVKTCHSNGSWSDGDHACIKPPKPEISCPPDIEAILPKGASKMVVTIPKPSANVDPELYVEAVPTLAPDWSAELSPGVHTITFIANNPVGTETSSCDITVTVLDNEPPTMASCPTSFEVQLAPNERSRAVEWKEPDFQDNVGVEYIHRSREPGNILPPGIYLVSYWARDFAGNNISCLFRVGVKASEIKTSPGQTENTFRKKLFTRYEQLEQEIEQRVTNSWRPPYKTPTRLPCPVVTSGGQRLTELPDGCQPQSELSVNSTTEATEPRKEAGSESQLSWTPGPAVRHMQSRTSFPWKSEKATQDSSRESSAEHRTRHHHGASPMSFVEWQAMRIREMEQRLQQLLRSRNCS